MSFTLAEVERAIRDAWSAATSFATDDVTYSPDRPSRGQCGPTSLVVHDLFGGDLLVADVSVNGAARGVHYWNRIGPYLTVDLTRDQFGPEETVDHPPRVVPRLPLPRPERARAAYLLLRDRVFAALDIAPDRT